MGRSPTLVGGFEFSRQNPGATMSTDLKDASIAIDPEACWQVLERAAASPPLKRAARLREFLLYVGAKSLKEGRTEIHEQEIGQAVFGRAGPYDTSQDNIVRVSATELRKRVDAYFASEGLEERIVFGIPRGSYTPSFRLRATAAPHGAAIAAGEPAAPENHAPLAAPADRWRRFLLVFVSAVALVLAIACLLLWRQNQSLRRRIKSPTPPAVSSLPGHPDRPF